MKLFEAREYFSNIVTEYLSKSGFVVKEKTKGTSADGFIIYELKYDESVTYRLELSYTSYLAAHPMFYVYYDEIAKIVKQLHPEYFEDGGGYTFSSSPFEYFDPSNADGYLNVTAGLYFYIQEPYEASALETQARGFCEKTIIPVISAIIPRTNSIEKADKILNEDYIIKKAKKNWYTIKKSKKTWYTSVLVAYIPQQMMMSLLLARQFNRSELPALIDTYSNYLTPKYDDNNIHFVLLKKVIDYLSSPEIRR